MTFNAIKNLGLATIVLILVSLVLFAHQHSQRTVAAIGHLVSVDMPAIASLRQATEKLRRGQLAFELYRRRDVVSPDSVLEPLEQMHEVNRQLTIEFPQFEHRSASLDAELRNVQLGFHSYLEEEQTDHASEEATQFASQARASLGVLWRR